MRYLFSAVCLLLLFPSVAFEADRPVPFAVGETLTYDVSWTRFLTAGSATLSVRERRAAGGGRTSYYLHAEAKPGSLVDRLYHLYYKAESFLDTETLRPSLSTVYSDEKGRIARRLMRFRAGNVADYESQVRTSPVNKTEFKIQPGTVDPLSALYVIRTMPLKPGTVSWVPVASNGKNYRLRLSVSPREQIRTAVGTLPAVKITPLIQDENGRPATTRNLTVWMSDDARRLPLRVEVDLPVGSFRLTLASAKK